MTSKFFDTLKAFQTYRLVVRNGYIINLLLGCLPDFHVLFNKVKLAAGQKISIPPGQ